MSIHPFFCWLEGCEDQLDGSEDYLEGSEGQQEGSEGQSAGAEGQYVGTGKHVWTYVRMEFLPILQDFVPCWGCCPATLCDFTTSKRQGKGTADLMMPFGVLLKMYKH